MSESDQLSGGGGSSLSLFSGLGTSSVSGASESGLVNVEELSDSKLESLLEEQTASLSLLVLETLMFESFHERLASGQICLTPTAAATSSHPSGPGGGRDVIGRKGSGTLSGADTTSDTDSQPPTTGTSLLDVSHKSHLSNRKRSSSRTSLGSRGKALRLSEEQKCGIANKETERLVQELAKFRKTSQKESSHGFAEILERSLRLDELLNAKSQLTKRIEAAKISGGSGTGKNKYDCEKLEDCFRGEEASQRRRMQKLATKNGVLAGQIRRFTARIRLDSASAQESGPVDLEQLQLENASHCAKLDLRSCRVIALRRALSEAKRKRGIIVDRTRSEETRRSVTEKSLTETDKVMGEVWEAMPKVRSKMERQAEANGRLKEMVANYVAPSTDDYARLKIQEQKMLEERKVAERKEYLARLTRAVSDGQRKKRLTRAKSALTMTTRSSRMMEVEEDGERKGMTSAGGGSGRGKLVRGKTFNIEFKME